MKLILAGIFFVFISQNAFAQSERKADLTSHITSDAIVRFSQGRAPITAVSFNLGKETHRFDQSFAAAVDWFKDLSVNVQNASGKAVTYLDIAVTFMPPAGHDQVKPLRFSIFKGDRSLALKRQDSGLLLISDTTAIYNIHPDDSAKEYLGNRRSLDQVGFPVLIDEIQLQIEEAVFDDGTMWSAGNWY
jgi:hypothetical protein